MNIRDGKTVWGHTGGFPGIMTILNMYPQTGDVLVVQSNNPNPSATEGLAGAGKADVSGER